MRKNISTDPNVAADLGENDEIVKKVTTETVVGRRRRSPEPEFEAVPAASAVGDIETLDAEEIIIDADESDDEPEFTPGSIGELLTRAEDSLQNSQCNIRVLRKADSPGERFRNPCVSRRSEPPLRNIELTQSRAEIEDIVQAQYGGGHYYLQIQLGNRMLNGWNADLGDVRDDIAASVSAATTHPAAVIPPTPPVNAVDPLDSLLETLKKAEALRTVFGGGEAERRLESQIAELREMIANNNQPERKSERLTLLDAALSASSPDLQTKIINNLFPTDEAKDRHWFADALDVALTHKEELLAIGGPLIMSLLGAGQQQQPNVAQLLQAQHVPQQPPPMIPQPTPEPERPFQAIFDEPAEPADTEPNTETDEAAIEVVEEVDLKEGDQS